MPRPTAGGGYRDGVIAALNAEHAVRRIRNGSNGRRLRGGSGSPEVAGREGEDPPRTALRRNPKSKISKNPKICAALVRRYATMFCIDGPDMGLTLNDQVERRHVLLPRPAATVGGTVFLRIAKKLGCAQVARITSRSLSQAAFEPPAAPSSSPGVSDAHRRCAPSLSSQLKEPPPGRRRHLAFGGRPSLLPPCSRTIGTGLSNPGASEAVIRPQVNNPTCHAEGRTQGGGGGGGCHSRTPIPRLRDRGHSCVGRARTNGLIRDDTIMLQHGPR